MMTEVRGHHFIFINGFLENPERCVHGDKTVEWLLSDPTREILITDQCDTVCRGEHGERCSEYDGITTNVCRQDEHIRKHYPPSLNGYVVDHDRRIAGDYGFPVGTATTVAELVRQLQNGPRVWDQKQERGPKIVSRLRSWLGSRKEYFLGR